MSEVLDRQICLLCNIETLSINIWASRFFSSLYNSKMLNSIFKKMCVLYVFSRWSIYLSTLTFGILHRPRDSDVLHKKVKLKYLSQAKKRNKCVSGNGSEYFR